MLHLTLKWRKPDQTMFKQWNSTRTLSNLAPPIFNGNTLAKTMGMDKWRKLGRFWLGKSFTLNMFKFFIFIEQSPFDSLKLLYSKCYKKLKCVCLAKIIFTNLFYYSTYFCYYSWVSLHFLVLFMSLFVLFQLIFTFIYSTFSKKFSVSAK